MGDRYRLARGARADLEVTFAIGVEATRAAAERLLATKQRLDELAYGRAGDCGDTGVCPDRAECTREDACRLDRGDAERRYKCWPSSPPMGECWGRWEDCVCRPVVTELGFQRAGLL